MAEKEIIFGAAYYEEYLPCDRVEQDMEMMAEAGINTIRIGESTWSVLEPRPGEFDFSHIDRVIDAADRHGIRVIVGTPTYAVPHWLAKLDPDVMAVTKDGRNRFGYRQSMDITNQTYLRYAERVIRQIVSHTAGRKNVIGFQIDNETKHYGTAGEHVMELFRRWMEERYGTIERVNEAFGLNYWSNSVTSFADLPDPLGTVIGGYGCEFSIFQRELAAKFLRWQAGIVDEYRRSDQFITQNFDYEWNFFGAPGQQDGYSGGIQPDLCHFDASKALTLVGTDIYFFTQDKLTGKEIAFGGDLMRPLKHDHYLVLESQAQAFKDWLPYPGQLRQIAYSHLASGACGQLFWGWNSLPCGLESYWKGVLSHDCAPNPTYREIGETGQELKRLSGKLSGLKKDNRIALVVSTEALNALKWFPTDKDLNYNAVVHWMYDALYELNLECDVIFEKEQDWSGYRMLVFPELYCAKESTIARVRDFVAQGGTVLAAFRSFYADERLKIHSDAQPHGLTDVFGMTYSQYTRPVNVQVDGAKAQYWMELLNPVTAECAAAYTHPYWGDYAAVTRNRYKDGYAWYIGTMMEADRLKDYLLRAAADAGIYPETDFRWPVTVRNASARDGAKLHFLFNYSSETCALSSPWRGTDLLTGQDYEKGDRLSLRDWDVCVLEEAGDPSEK